MKRILTTRAMFPSARLLRDDLEEVLDERIYITTTAKTGIILRWGSTMDVGYEVGINDVSAIQLASDKLMWSKRLQEAGIFTPIYKTEAPLEQDYPILIRTTLHGFGGAGIHVCKTAEEYARFAGNYWTRFVRISSEFRVHVLGKTPVRLFRKVREENEPEEEFPIRNLHRGYSFKLSDMTQKQKLLSVVDSVMTCIQATEKTMLALDVGWTNNGWFILEANSAPAMTNPNTRNLYVEHIAKFLRS